MNDRKKLLSDSKRYLEQQAELYGQDFVIEPSKRQDTTSRSKVSHHTTQAGLGLDTLAAANEAGDMSVSLSKLKEIVSGCVKCELCQSRTQTVFGGGVLKRKIFGGLAMINYLMFIRHIAGPYNANFS